MTAFVEYSGDVGAALKPRGLKKVAVVGAGGHKRPSHGAWQSVLLFRCACNECNGRSKRLASCRKPERPALTKRGAGPAKSVASAMGPAPKRTPCSPLPPTSTASRGRGHGRPGGRVPLTRSECARGPVTQAAGVPNSQSTGGAVGFCVLERKAGMKK